MTREEILTKKKDGDWVLVGEMLKCSADCARFRFSRPSSKKYPAVYNAIVKVIENRESLIKQQEDNNSK